ncbi:MAG: hypothetical protein KJ732_02860, partial [Candidatus Margulisbacteria bacterium]|nr:hypothetical protein [Candidatus Margulisiibacteriota bacterium]
LLDEAEKMLGKHYSLTGSVESGKKIAGTKLLHPTANMKINYGIVPPNGVYAGYVFIKNKKYPAAVAIGVSPTFNYANNEHPRVEVHLLDFEGDIYGSQDYDDKGVIISIPMNIFYQNDSKDTFYTAFAPWGTYAGYLVSSGSPILSTLKEINPVEIRALIHKVKL